MTNGIEKLLAEAAKCTWQDIKFAPRDGTLVDLYVPDFGYSIVCAWKTPFDKTEPTWVMRWDGETFHNRIGSPTHFRHLDTPDNDIVARLAAALEVAVEGLAFYANPNEYCRERRGDSGQNWIECDDGVSGVAEEALARINTIAASAPLPLASRGDAVVEGA